MNLRLAAFWAMVLLPLWASAQIQVSFPVSRAVFQRTTNNDAILHVNGYFTQTVSRIEARVQARNGQGTSSDWVTIQANPKGGTFSGNLTVRGGWYNLEVRGMNGDQPVGSTTVERVGVGEVFIIAGQSNAQGVQIDVPGASDDRVSTINYADDNQSPNTPPADVLTRFTHLDKGGRIAPSGLGSWCWGKLGDLLAQRLNVPILFFNVGYEGAAIRNWRQSFEVGRTESIYLRGAFYVDGQPYGNLRNAMQFFTHMLGVRAVLWHHGEAEFFAQTPLGSYANDLQAVINRSRQDSGKNIAWVVARASYSGDGRGSRSEIIAAQNQVITSVPNVFAGPSTDGIQVPRKQPSRLAAVFDDVHFNADGLDEVAHGWNSSLTDAFFAMAPPQPSAPAPTVSVECSSDNQVAIRINGSFSSVSWSSGESDATIRKGAGTYRATVKDGLGNVLLSPVVRVPDAPSIEVSGPTTFCAGGSVVLNATYSNNLTWTTNATSQSIVVSTSGDYAVQYQDVSGCRLISPKVSIRVNPLPAAPTITAAKPTTFCQGESTSLTTSEGASYRWNSGQTNRSIDVQSAGIYTVTTTDQNGCVSSPSPSLTVVVNPLPPTPVITANRSTTFCADQQVTLTGTPEQRYQWSSGQTDQNITVNQSGSYSLRTQNSFNCFSSLSAPIVVQVNPLPPAPTLTASGQTVFCEGEQVSLTAASSFPIRWTTTDTTRTITVRQSGIYAARAEDAIGCLSPVARALTVDVKPRPDVPLLNQIGTYTLSAKSLLPGVYYRWSFNNEALSAQTETIKAGRSGLYSAQASLAYTPTLTCSSIASLGLAFLADDTNSGISVYPNPSPNKQISVETQEDLSDGDILIYTLNGEEVARFRVPLFNERKSLDLSGLTDGLYLVQVRVANRLLTKRFVIGVGM